MPTPTWNPFFRLDNHQSICQVRLLFSRQCNPVAQTCFIKMQTNYKVMWHLFPWWYGLVNAYVNKKTTVSQAQALIDTNVHPKTDEECCSAACLTTVLILHMKDNSRFFLNNILFYKQIKNHTSSRFCLWNLKCVKVLSSRFIFWNGALSYMGYLDFYSFSKRNHYINTPIYTNT